jgi:hypothetical protein
MTDPRRIHASHRHRVLLEFGRLASFAAFPGKVPQIGDNAG